MAFTPIMFGGTNAAATLAMISSRKETFDPALIVEKKSDLMFQQIIHPYTEDESFIPTRIPDYWPPPKKQPNNPVFIIKSNRRKSYRRRK